MLPWKTLVSVCVCLVGMLFTQYAEAACGVNRSCAVNRGVSRNVTVVTTTTREVRGSTFGERLLRNDVVDRRLSSRRSGDLLLDQNDQLSRENAQLQNQVRQLKRDVQRGR